jgi:hypothetical protein
MDENGLETDENGQGKTLSLSSGPSVFVHLMSIPLPCPFSSIGPVFSLARFSCTKVPAYAIRLKKYEHAMKKFISLSLILAITSTSGTLFARDLADYTKNTDKLYQPGGGAEAGGYSGISMSMVGWGLGLAGGIALLASLLTQSKSSSGHTKTKNANCH